MKEKIAFYTLTAFIRIIALCPFWILYFISSCIYPFVYYIFRYRHNTVRKNLTNSFPEKSLKEIKTIEKKFYRHFCDHILETIKLANISKKEIQKRMKFTNCEIIEELLKKDGRPVFLYLGHQGNWEYLSSITTWLTTESPVYQVYHPLTSKVMDRFMLWLRSKFKAQCVPQKQTLRTIITSVNQNKPSIFGLISDQRPAKRPEPEWMTFLNQETAIITGAEAIGTKINAHFLYGSMKCVKRGYYEITFEPIIPAENEKFPYSKQYMRLLEKDIMEQPHIWLWSHNRWKWRRRIKNNNLS